MVARVLLGERGGGYGLWVSKPGIDVMTAPEGRLLLSGTVGAQQIMAHGQNVLNNGPVVTGPATYTVSLPADLAGLSNLLVWGLVWRVDNYSGVPSGFQYWYEKYRQNDASFRVVNGILYVYSNLSGSIGSTGSPVSLWCRWVIFREQY